MMETATRYARVDAQTDAASDRISVFATKVSSKSGANVSHSVPTANTDAALLPTSVFATKDFIKILKDPVYQAVKIPASKDIVTAVEIVLVQMINSSIQSCWNLESATGRFAQESVINHARMDTAWVEIAAIACTDIGSPTMISSNVIQYVIRTTSTVQMESVKHPTNVLAKVDSNWK